MAHAGRTFRIFVSSTFTDLQEERNALQRRVFPALKKRCAEDGCQFQAIDLRWGVGEEAGLDQRTMRICLEELERCRQTSPRPNFILLLGDRYGWQPLPEVISAEEFELILTLVPCAEEKKLLNTWYRRDDNALFPVYELQPRTGEYVDFEVWGKIEHKLRSSLQEAVEKIGLEPKQLFKYRASATEQEINEGAMKIKGAADHVFCFFRSIESLPQEFSTSSFQEVLKARINKKHTRGLDSSCQELFESIMALSQDSTARDVDEHIKSRADQTPEETPESEFLQFAYQTLVDFTGKDFIDLDEKEWVIDQKAQSKQQALKNRLRRYIPDNVYEYRAQWTGDGITTDHIDQLCEDVYTSLEKIISSEIAKIQDKPYLEKEIEDHERFGKERAEIFVGRSDFLNRISKYIAGYSPHLLGIYGEGGSGKSALAAFALKEAHKDYRHRAIVVSRFIGATLNSSDGRSLLEDLCRQISLNYGQEADPPTTFEELVEEFPKRLALASAEKPLIIFLDSLDQLTSAHNARSLTWLPEKLPENVRMVLTTRPGEYLVALRHKLPSENIIELGPMSMKEGEELLDKWLGDAGRTLQTRQRKEVLDKFSACGWPLYLKLAFEEARLWKSYTEEIVLSQGKEGIIENNLFKRLETEHGTMMVSRTLGYIAATREIMGLAEDEILDILSGDEEFFKDFLDRTKHVPPEPKLPVAVWARLFFDLESYLAVKSHENTALLTFFHREIGDVARRSYLEQNEVKYQQVLADYFLRKAEPEYDSGKKDKEWTWQGEPRALSELPFHLTRAEKWDQLFKTLVDFNFLEQKAARVGVQESFDAGGNKTISYTGALALLEDYDLALSAYPDQ